MVDGNDIWEALFGIMNGDVPDAMTSEVCSQLAGALEWATTPGGDLLEQAAGEDPKLNLAPSPARDGAGS